MHRGLIISTMQAVFCSLHLLLYISAIRGQHPWASLWCTEDLLYPPWRQCSVHYVASLYFSYKRSASLSQFVMHRGLIISTMQAVFCSLYASLYFSYKRSASLSHFVMHRGLIISTMQAVFCSLYASLYFSYKRSASLSQFVVHRGLIISTMQAVFCSLYASLYFQL